MAITIAARKDKARKLQNDTRQILLDTLGKDLKPDHIRGAIMGESGEDLPMTEDARDVLSGYEFECKAYDEATKSDVYAALRQAQARLQPGNRYCAVFRKDRNNPMYAIIEFQEFAQLLRNAHVLRRLAPVLQTILRYTNELGTDNKDINFIQHELKRLVDEDLKDILTKRNTQ
jgi:hypothetical protein